MKFIAAISAITLGMFAGQASAQDEGTPSAGTATCVRKTSHVR